MKSRRDCPAGFSCLEPIVESEVWNTLELANVVGHEDSVEVMSMGGDEQVIGSDEPALRFKFSFARGKAE